MASLEDYMIVYLPVNVYCNCIVSISVIMYVDIVCTTS